MSIKSEEALTVICSGHDLTIEEIGEKSSEVMPKMLSEIKQYGLEISGPAVFVSYGRTGNLSQVFRHEYCIPIKSPMNYKGTFQIKELQGIQCVSGLFKGTLMDILITRIYTLLEEANNKKACLTGQMREVYHVWETAESENNQIELQLAINV